MCYFHGTTSRFHTPGSLSYHANHCAESRCQNKKNPRKRYSRNMSYVRTKFRIVGYLGIGFCSASFFLSKCLISVPRKRPRKRPTFFTYLQPVLLPHFFQWTFAPPPLRHSTWHTNDTKKCTKMAKVWKNMKLCWPLAGFTKVNRTYVFFEMAEFPPKQTTTEPLTKRTRFWCYHKVLQSTRFIFFLNMSTLKLVEPGKKYPVFRWNAGWEWDTQQAGLIALYTQLRTIPYSWVQSTIDSWYPWVFSLL